MINDRDFITNELRISCADAVELVTHYLDNALSPSDLTEFETHLHQCEGCQVFLDQIRTTITLTSQSLQTTIALEPAAMNQLLTALDERAIPPADDSLHQ